VTHVLNDRLVPVAATDGVKRRRRLPAERRQEQSQIEQEALREADMDDPRAIDLGHGARRMESIRYE
jgi:hypothetical protein